MNVLRRITKIRDGEGLRASLMFSYIFLVIASILILKPVRNSLFLTKFGIEHLPYVYILVAVCAAAVIPIYWRIARKMRLNWLVASTLLFCIVNLLIFRVLLQQNSTSGWLAYVFYTWVAIFSVIVSTQFWLLTNFVFNAREAKRLFGFVGAGAITGGIAGGYLTRWLVPVFGTMNMIFLCCVALVGCLCILVVVWLKSARKNYRERRFQIKREQRGQSETPLRMILKSPHLRLLAGIVGVSVVVANLVDYQFNAIVLSRIKDQDQLTAFFGLWLSNLSIFSLIIQLFFTPRILMKYGVGASLFFLPLGILTGAIGVLFKPGLITGLITKISDGGFKHSMNKVGLELLYLPLPSEVKSNAKAFIDVFVDSFAQGLGGVLLILFTGFAGSKVITISLLVIFFIGVWLAMVVTARKEYVNAFRMAIEKRTIDLDDSVNLEDAAVFDFLVRILQHESDRRVLYVLNLIENSSNQKLVPYLRNLLERPNNEIKTQTLRMLHNFTSENFLQQVEPLVSDPDFEVRVEAIRYLIFRAKDKYSLIQQLFQTSDKQVRAAALMVAAGEYGRNKELRRNFQLVEEFKKLVAEVQNDPDPELRINGARIIGEAKDPALYPYLHELLDSRSPDILKAAIEAAGNSKADEFIPVLIRHLNTKQVRKQARLALAAYGEKIVDTLLARLNDPGENKIIRLSIPKVLALIDSQRGVDHLIRMLDEPDLLLRYEVLKALSKLKATFPSLKINKELVTKEIIEETRYYNRTLAILYANMNRNNVEDVPVQKARRLLIRALEERLDINQERIFRLLGLRYSPEDMFNAYRGIVSKRNELRANAVEFLDNVLDTSLKEYILPIIEMQSSDAGFPAANRFLKSDSTSEPKSLESILNGDDSWLRICALYLIAELKSRESIPVVTTLTNDTDPLVRETAVFALRQLGAIA